jgi:phosphoribosyl-dephospho-CoA transferase
MSACSAEDRPVGTTPLHRHQLARLGAAGWERVQRRDWDAEARACLAHWAARGLPLVVTRQPAAAASRRDIAMGLPAPGRWGRRRLALQVPREDVSNFDEFPAARRVGRLLAPALRAAWQRLCDELVACGVSARVHGSYGWQQLTGLDHVRSTSDLDLWISVSGPAQADEVAHRLQAFGLERPRLDGELVFDDGHAVAWREWLAWRAGRTRALLVKRLDGSALSAQPFEHHARCAAEALA